VQEVGDACGCADKINDVIFDVFETFNERKKKAQVEAVHDLYDKRRDMNG